VWVNLLESAEVARVTRQSNVPDLWQMNGWRRGLLETLLRLSCEWDGFLWKVCKSKVFECLGCNFFKSWVMWHLLDVLYWVWVGKRVIMTKVWQRAWLDWDFYSYFCPNQPNLNRKCCCPNFVEMPLGYELVWKLWLWHFCPFFVQILDYVSIWTKLVLNDCECSIRVLVYINKQSMAGRSQEERMCTPG
jgi:hypothetical protein